MLGEDRSNCWQTGLGGQGAVSDTDRLGLAPRNHGNRLDRSEAEERKRGLLLPRGHARV